MKRSRCQSANLPPIEIHTIIPHHTAVMGPAQPDTRNGIRAQIHLPGREMMRYEMHGTLLQSVDVYLSQGESVFTESGGMAWMRGDIEMKTGTKGGLMAGLGRKLAGESLFMTTYTCKSGEGMIVFTPEAPGKVLDFQLQPGQSLICQKDAFMCAESSVKLEMHFRKKLGAGLFGGEGFILQKITGPGTAFLEIPGEVREYTLAAGEMMQVDPGHIALFEPMVNYDITTVKGLKNVLFSGEGLFLATLTGPGRIWLQSLPLSNLAGKLAKYMPTKSA
jgi:uncharacterized protein (TIGR00266 family)